MGRFYGGDIEGKFWFGVQDSCDISNLVDIEYTIGHIWKACGCSARIDDKFCEDCYDNYDEHVLAVKEEYDDYEEGDLLYEEGNEIYYNLYKDWHYDELTETLEQLKSKIPEKVMNELDKLEENKKIISAFSGYFDSVFEEYNKLNSEDNDANSNQSINNSAQFIARYVLGLQIKYCLEKNDMCAVICEC
jgi:uncharacterized protein YdcH (DUF465 family)